MKIELDQTTVDLAEYAKKLMSKKNLEQKEDRTLDIIIQAIAHRVIFAIQEENILNKK